MAAMLLMCYNVITMLEVPSLGLLACIIKCLAAAVKGRSERLDNLCLPSQLNFRESVSHANTLI